MNRARWLGVVILVIVLVVVFLYLTRGFLWSFQETSFQGLLNSLPEPPKWVPETNRLSTSPYVPDGYRYYDVAGQHAQVVQFFNQGTLEPDWQLVREQNRLTPGSDNSYMKTTSLLFPTINAIVWRSVWVRWLIDKVLSYMRESGFT